MKLTLLGHDDRYAVEQLQMALFPEGTEGEAVSALHRLCDKPLRLSRLPDPRPLETGGRSGSCPRK